MSESGRGEGGRQRERQGERVRERERERHRDAEQRDGEGERGDKGSHWIRELFLHSARSDICSQRVATRASAKDMFCLSV